MNDFVPESVVGVVTGLVTVEPGAFMEPLAGDPAPPPPPHPASPAARGSTAAVASNPAEVERRFAPRIELKKVLAAIEKLLKRLIEVLSN
jgi:hypothetical protein